MWWGRCGYWPSGPAGQEDGFPDSPSAVPWHQVAEGRCKEGRSDGVPACPAELLSVNHSACVPWWEGPSPQVLRMSWSWHLLKFFCLFNSPVTIFSFYLTEGEVTCPSRSLCTGQHVLILLSNWSQESGILIIRKNIQWTWVIKVGWSCLFSFFSWKQRTVCDDVIEAPDMLKLIRLKGY